MAIVRLVVHNDILNCFRTENNKRRINWGTYFKFNVCKFSNTYPIFKERDMKI